jgi:hypothetical protein
MVEGIAGVILPLMKNIQVNPGKNFFTSSFREQALMQVRMVKTA